MLPKSKYFIKTRKAGVFTPSESSIQNTCVDLLKLDGWRHLRTDPVSDRATVNAIRAKLQRAGLLTPDVAKLLNARGKGFGEVGMADDLFIRYKSPCKEHPDKETANARNILCGLPISETLWCEFKSLNGKPKPEQLAWAAAEKARGALIWMATVDFEPTIEGFRKKYRESGLARRGH